MASGRGRLIGIVLTAAVIAAGGYVLAEKWRRYDMEDRLLRAADPADDPSLLAYSVALARPLFEARCARCHGRDMRGDSARGAPALAANHWLYGTGDVAHIERTILHGVRAGDAKGRNLADMPAFGLETPYAREKIPPLSPDEIDAVAEYVLRLRGVDAQPEGAMRGAALFAGAGGCADCHAGDGRGDPVVGAADLTLSPGFFTDGSRAALRDIIANGHAGICPAWQGKLEFAEIRALAVYINGVARGRIRPEDKT